MHALVVYESMYGNTMHVAEAIAAGLGSDADLVDVDDAPTAISPDVDLLVIGGPTHAHGLTTAKSRADAAGRGERPIVSSTGIRDWIGALRPEHPIAVATFDTRIDGPKLLWGSAADSAAKLLRHDPIQMVATASFVLDGMTGSPYDRVPASELERARAWGRSLAKTLASPRP